MSILTVQNFSMSYGGRTVLNNLSFNLDKGSYLCVIGENGAGKSTLIKGILNLAKTESGSIILGDGIKRSDIGYLPQQTDIQRNFPCLVKEVIMSGFLNNGGILGYKKAQKEKAEKIAKSLGIFDSFGSSYRALSGGQQQRVLMARSLCAAKKMLILDEPVASLDVVAAGELYEHLETLNRDGMTIIMVTHDINTALKHASHVLFLGSKTFFGKVDDFAIIMKEEK